MNTIVLMRPIRLDSDAATTDDMAERIAMMEKIVPRYPVGRENLL